jgi:threonine dehydratase
MCASHDRRGRARLYLAMPIHTEIDERHVTPEASAAANAVAAASRRLAPFAVETPVIPAPSLGPATWYKCENVQRTGSFKLRGALNKLLTLSSDQRERGVVASSTGNHGLAVAAGLALTSGRGTVVVSRAASPYKIERLTQAGLEVITSDGDPMAAELEARALAEREGRVYISPYNDADVLAGQGTVAVEVLAQRPDLEAVFVAVGGGGLVAGIAAYLKSVRPDVTIVGCWPERAAAMYQSVRAGRLVDVPDQETLSDGTAGNIEPGAITFPLCRDLIDELVLVTEDEIATAMRDVLVRDHLLIEGAAGVAVAGWRAFTAARPRLSSRVSVIILCGGNVSAKTVREVLAGGVR